MDVETGGGGVPGNPGRILVVDDDISIGSSYGLALRRLGYRVEVLDDARAALDRVGAVAFDAVLSDIAMPRVNGIDFLRHIKERNLDVPVVLMTSDPRLETAIRAVEFGAAHYLVKPVSPPDLDRAMGRAVLMHRLARLKRLAQGAPTTENLALMDEAALERRFDNVLDTLWPAFQPIVSWSGKRVYAYEALLRANEPSLPSPLDVIAAAERLDALPQLGRTMRHRAAQHAARALPPGALLFINLHPEDFGDEELYDPHTPLAALADRVVLEITERASLDDLPDVRARTAELRKLGYRLAVDDLGAGYAGLSSVVQLEPEVVKIDMSLVRDVDRAGPRQHVIRSLAGLCHDLGMLVICEGVETAAERDTLAAFECDLMQGYLFGKPGPGFAEGRY